MSGTYNLPKNWKNISGLHLSESNLEFLASLGWQPVIKQHQDFDPNVSAVMGLQHTLQDGAVIETLRLVSSQGFYEPPQRQFLRSLRTRRNQLLAETDWTQLADAKLAEEDMIRYLDYRQRLRDLPSEIGPDVLSLDQVDWPIPPENL